MTNIVETLRPNVLVPARIECRGDTSYLPFQEENPFTLRANTFTCMFKREAGEDGTFTYSLLFGPSPLANATGAPSDHAGGLTDGLAVFLNRTPLALGEFRNLKDGDAIEMTGAHIPSGKISLIFYHDVVTVGSKTDVFSLLQFILDPLGDKPSIQKAVTALKKDGLRHADRDIAQAAGLVFLHLTRHHSDLMGTAQ